LSTLDRKKPKEVWRSIDRRPRLGKCGGLRRVGEGLKEEVEED
jgi:hypothetical protein